MSEIYSTQIYEAVKHLCLTANVNLNKFEYEKLKNLYKNETNKNAKIALAQILKNAMLANQTQRPLCQDTGFVTVFVLIGNNVNLHGDNLNKTIECAVADAYTEYFFRKSIVNDALFKRENTGNNTPVLIHIEFVNGDNIEIILSPKGGGCENVSAIKMLSPADGLSGIKNFVLDTVKNANSKPCPPIKIGIGIGSNFEGAAILSKKALLKDDIQNNEYSNLAQEILEDVNNLNIGAMGVGGNSTCFGVNILSQPCHIASLPVAISISCHSSRHAKAVISENHVVYDYEKYDFEDITIPQLEIIQLSTNEIDKIKQLPIGTNVELSGKIYTARDAAHAKIFEKISKQESLPFALTNAIIFYAGPCPANDSEIIGPIGPTTSARMDKYTPVLFEHGLLATIGKGERSKEVTNVIQSYNGKYFTVTGGIASLLKKCIKSAKVVAYPELGPEAVFELEVDKLPLVVKI